MRKTHELYLSERRKAEELQAKYNQVSESNIQLKRSGLHLSGLNSCPTEDHLDILPIRSSRNSENRDKKMFSNPESAIRIKKTNSQV